MVWVWLVFFGWDWWNRSRVFLFKVFLCWAKKSMMIRQEYVSRDWLVGILLVYSLEVQSTKQSGWSLGGYMEQGFPILPMSKVWSAWTPWVYSLESLEIRKNFSLKLEGFQNFIDDFNKPSKIE